MLPATDSAWEAATTTARSPVPQDVALGDWD